MANKRECWVCGAVYDYCPKCGKSAGQPGWKINFDEESCKDLFDCVSGYNMKIKTIDDVKKIIDKYNIKDFSKYKEKIKKVLDLTIEKVEVETPVVEEVVTPVQNKKNRYKKSVDIELNEAVDKKTDMFEGISEE